MTLVSVPPEAREHAQDLLNFIDASPSPWHAVATVERLLQERGFERLDEAKPWRLDAGSKYYVVRDQSSIVFFIAGCRPPPEAGFHIAGAHTDSPGFRIKPRAPHIAETMVRLGVEIYGGPILATFTDRDLSLAGRVCLRRPSSPPVLQLVHFERPLIRLPNLAIHMNREVNELGLKLNKQTELPLLLANLERVLEPLDQFHALLAAELTCEARDILSWELAVYDTQEGAFWGPAQEFIANSQLDNLASCHAALRAFLPLENPGRTCLCAFFDHEEIGSESAKGAAGSLLTDTLERIAIALGTSREGYKQALARSFLVSVDMAHAYHPNFPLAYEPEHKAVVNNGPVIKTNANQRYSTGSVTEAQFIDWCEAADVPYQRYAHRSDLPCGSTIGPIASARLGVRSIDVGSPMWAMHSVRESAGALDHAYLIRALQQFFSS
jgi:aspartyl aminopeptidase